MVFNISIIFFTYGNAQRKPSGMSSFATRERHIDKYDIRNTLIE